MSWDQEHLWAKSKIFFGRAFAHSPEDSCFGLWCALGLELLARSAVAAVSPTLLAAPEPDHKNLLHALGRGAERDGKKSLEISRVISLCRKLYPEFLPDHEKSMRALASRRNDELHSGTAAFEEYTTQHWIAGFYSCCKVLSEAIGKDLADTFGPEEAKAANKVLQEAREEVKQRVLNAIASHKQVFGAKGPDDREAIFSKVKAEGDRLSHMGHHRVKCPACDCWATVQGHPFGPERVESGQQEIVLRQAVSPHSFECRACALKLSGYGELTAAGVADQYTRTTTIEPSEYYDLIDPEDDATIGELVQQFLEGHAGYDEYNNE